MTPSTRRQPASAFCSSFRISVAIWTGPVNSWTRKRKASSRPAVIRSSTPRSVPTTTTAASTRLATRTPEENTAATRLCAPTWASRVTGDVDTISLFVQWGGIMLLVSVLQIGVATVLMLVYSWPLALVVWAAFLPLMLILRPAQRRVSKAYGAVRVRTGAMLGAISEAVVGAETIRAYGVGERTQRRIDAAVRDTRDAQVGAQRRVAAVFSSGVLVANLVLAAVVVVGTLLGVDDRITAGRLLAFLFLVQLFTGPVQMATEILNELQNALAGWRRVLGVIDTRAEITDPHGGGTPTTRGAGQVELRGVRFAYPDGPVGRADVSCVAPARARAAVVGATLARAGTTIDTSSSTTGPSG